MTAGTADDVGAGVDGLAWTPLVSSPSRAVFANGIHCAPRQPMARRSHGIHAAPYLSYLPKDGQSTIGGNGRTGRCYFRGAANGDLLSGSVDVLASRGLASTGVSG